MGYIINGTFVNHEEIVLPIHKNGSFWYGDGFFETMKYANGMILFEDLHWERIVTSCSVLKMKNPLA